MVAAALCHAFQRHTPPSCPPGPADGWLPTVYPRPAHGRVALTGEPSKRLPPPPAPGCASVLFGCAENGACLRSQVPQANAGTYGIASTCPYSPIESISEGSSAMSPSNITHNVRIVRYDRRQFGRLIHKTPPSDANRGPARLVAASQRRKHHVGLFQR